MPRRAEPVAASILGVTVSCISSPSRSMVIGQRLLPACATQQRELRAGGQLHIVALADQVSGQDAATPAGWDRPRPDRWYRPPAPRRYAATPWPCRRGSAAFPGDLPSTFFSGSRPIRDNSSSEVPAVSLLRETAPLARRVSSSLADTAAVPAWVVRVSNGPS
jgi:hypothetical protein